jgi:hypothetical protein
MAAFLDGCRFNPAAGGTTDWTYSSAVPGYQSPAAANIVNGRFYKYRAESADLSQWEFGEGAYNTGTGVLVRTTVLYNSSGTTSKINFTTTPQVAIVALKEDLISVEEANSFTTAQQAQARLNLGINQMTALSASQNLNSVTSSGTYYTIDNSSTNAPAASTFWYLEVEVYGADPTHYIFQRATDLGGATSRTYVRTMVGGTWGGWRTTLFADSNLSDVANATTARHNLGTCIGIPDVIVEEQYANGVGPTGPTSSGFFARNLNTLVRNNGSIASLSSGSVTLPAGTYYAEWSAPSLSEQFHQAKLQNTTAGTVVAPGTSECSAPSSGVQTRSVGSCAFTLSGTASLAIYHAVTASNTLGFGRPGSLGIIEVFTRLVIYQMS